MAERRGVQRTVHDVLRRWRGVSDAFDPRRILIGETYGLDLDSLVPYYGNGDGFDPAAVRPHTVGGRDRPHLHRY